MQNRRWTRLYQFKDQLVYLGDFNETMLFSDMELPIPNIFEFNFFFAGIINVYVLPTFSNVCLISSARGSGAERFENWVLT